MNDTMLFLSDLYPAGSRMSLGESLLFAVCAMVIVMLIILILVGTVKVLALCHFKVEEAPAAPVLTQPARLKAEDLSEDEMVAALVATIDHKNETGKDARLVSIKKI